MKKLHGCGFIISSFYFYEITSCLYEISEGSNIIEFARLYKVIHIYVL